MPGTVQSVERAAAIVRLLAARDGRQLGEVATALGLPKSTAHGILRTLVEVGFVEQDPHSGDYRLPADPLAARLKPMDLNEMRARATNWVDSLAGRTRLSARLVVLPDAPAGAATCGVTAHHVFSASRAPQRVEIGEPVELTTCAEGKVLLAFAPGGGVVLDALQPRPAAASAPGVLRAEIARTRARGFGLDVGESAPAVAGVAVPVRSHGGIVVAAVGVRGTFDQVLTAARGAREDLVQSLDEAARGTSHALMARRW